MSDPTEWEKGFARGQSSAARELRVRIQELTAERDGLREVVNSLTDELRRNAQGPCSGGSL